jgi:tetratricopeptide (TPR) repeat protein
MSRWGALFLSWCLATSVVAQEQPTSQATKQQDQQKAGESFARGDALFREGKELEKAGKVEEAKAKYLSAASEFDAANQAYPDASFLYNAGICFMRAGLDGEAYNKFREYLTIYPTAPNREEVQQYVGQLALANPSLITKIVANPTSQPDISQPTSLVYVPSTIPSEGSLPPKEPGFCRKNKAVCLVMGSLALGAAGVTGNRVVFYSKHSFEHGDTDTVTGPKP